MATSGPVVGLLSTIEITPELALGILDVFGNTEKRPGFGGWSKRFTVKNGIPNDAKVNRTFVNQFGNVVIEFVSSAASQQFTPEITVEELT